MKSRQSTLRAGVIGTGFIGPVHIEALKRINVEVTAICGSDGAHRVADAWHIPLVFDGYNAQALIDCPEVDVVHITSPDVRHHEQAIAAIRAGKHVVCEKPLALNTEQTREIVALAARSDRVFAVNYNIRFYPMMLQLREWIASGELGDIIHINGHYFQDWLLHETDFNWRVLKTEAGPLRVVSDIGSHWMDLACFVMGTEIHKVFADLHIHHATRKRPKGSVETFSKQSPSAGEWESIPIETFDFGQVLLHFDNGAKGNLSVSQVACGRKNQVRLEVYGTRKSAWWDSQNPNYLEVGQRDSMNQVLMRNGPGMGGEVQRYMDYPAAHNEGFPDSFKMLYRNVYAHIRGDRSIERLYADAREGHRELAICDAILESAEHSTWANVQPLI